MGDLRLPDGEGPFPVAVIIHGGFWADVWQRDLMDAVAIDISRRGWATWNIEYRRVGSGGGWPGTQADVAAAIDAIPTLSDRLDPQRVIVVGHSAGGQLALWSAGRHPDSSAVVPMGVVALAPITDLTQAHRLGLDDGAVERYLRRSPDKDGARYRESSPVSLLPLGVPQVIVHGDLDDRVPVQMSRAYAGEAADAGDEVRYHEFEGSGHFEVIDPGHIVWSKIADEIDQFLS
ncbi:MAG: alpha/beta fold hydrolase [Acidimicrobiia bacterium]|nr:alpha/beta fold hydrolase [Acidimicrobiia bacterium]